MLRPAPPPPYLIVWMTAPPPLSHCLDDRPPPLSEGLDPPMLVATLELTSFLLCTLRKIITNSLYEFKINLESRTMQLRLHLNQNIPFQLL